MEKITTLYVNDPDLVKLATVSGNANKLVKRGRRIRFLSIRNCDEVFSDSEGASGIFFHPTSTVVCEGVKMPGGGVIEVHNKEKEGGIFKNITNLGILVWADGWFEPVASTRILFPDYPIDKDERIIGTFLAGNNSGTFMEGFVFGVVDIDYDNAK